MKKYQVFIDLSNEDGEVLDCKSVVVQAPSPEQARYTIGEVLCGGNIENKELQNEIQEIINHILDQELDFYVWEVTEDDIVED